MGAPWFGPGDGIGHLWPLLDGERAEQDLQAGDVRGASGLALTMQRMSWGVGLVPEQVWEDPDTPASPYGSDPATESIGFTNGKAAGSATPLIWAQAQYLQAPARPTDREAPRPARRHTGALSQGRSDRNARDDHLPGRGGHGVTGPPP